MERPYRDKAGKPLTQEEWVALFEMHGYRDVKRTEIGESVVSTLWHGGYSTSEPGERPLIFETAVFDNPFGDDSWSRDTATLAGANAMHKAAVAWVKGKAPQPDLRDYELKEAEDTFRELTAKAEYARERRNRIVHDAAASGWSHARIADATGLTRGRIGQITAQATAR